MIHKFLFFFIIFSVLISCQSSRQTRSDYSEEFKTNIINNQGVLEATSLQGRYEYYIDEIGKSYSLPNGVPITLTFASYLDLVNISLEFYYEEGSDNIVLTVVPKDEPVVLKKKCDKFVRTNLFDLKQLPPIILLNNLSPEQIVITPLCDAVGVVFGYEFRYGTVESGCKAEAKEGLASFRKCKENVNVQKRRKTDLNDPRYYLGLPR